MRYVTLVLLALMLFIGCSGKEAEKTIDRKDVVAIASLSSAEERQKEYTSYLKQYSKALEKRLTKEQKELFKKTEESWLNFYKINGEKEDDIETRLYMIENYYRMTFADYLYITTMEFIEYDVIESSFNDLVKQIDSSNTALLENQQVWEQWKENEFAFIDAMSSYLDNGSNAEFQKRGRVALLRERINFLLTALQQQ